MPKVKIFLGAYVNSTNAQNLNCLALAEHLDKKIFDVFTLEIYSGNLQNASIKGVRIFRCFKPLKISKYVGYLWGIYKCDIAYLPKTDIYRWNSFWIKLLKRKSFSTVEGILDKVAIKKASNLLGSYENVIDSYNQYDRIYSITKYLSKYNYKHHLLKSEQKTLYLGINLSAFLNKQIHAVSLRNVLIIGNDLLRKGIYDYFKIASHFPSLNFHIVGSGNGEININDLLAKEKLKNITYLGSLKGLEIFELLKTMDLHLLPSRSEGFPKVTLETAAAGVPSLLYSDYGSNEWITHHQDGFVVDTLEQMIETVRLLTNNPDLLKKTAINSVAMAKRFDWSILVKEWEEVIQSINNSH